MLNRPAHPIHRAALAVWRLPRLLLIGVVRFYQVAISPLTPPSCRYTPTCSEYAMIALREYGFVRGTILAVWRILRCAPSCGHVPDPPRWFAEPNPPQPVTAAGVEPSEVTHSASPSALEDRAEKHEPEASVRPPLT